MAEYSSTEIQYLINQLESKCRIQGYRGVVYIHSDSGQPILNKQIGWDDSARQDVEVKRKASGKQDVEIKPKANGKEGMKGKWEDNPEQGVFPKLESVPKNVNTLEDAIILGDITQDLIRSKRASNMSEAKQAVHKNARTFNKMKHIYYLHITKPAKFTEVVNDWKANGTSKSIQELNDSYCKAHVDKEVLGKMVSDKELTLFEENDLKINN